MATYTSAATGNWSAGSTWVGGVKPPSGAGHSIVIAAGHVVTYDEAAGTYGDDTANSVVLTGTLKASRSVSTQLTLRGDLAVNAGAVLDWGTEADPIPAGVVAEIVQNDSATQANNKWGITFRNTAVWGGFKMWGATKLDRTVVPAGGLAAGATSMVLPDVTGWNVGDILGFGPATSDPTTRTARAIASISGTGPYTVTWSGGLAASTPAGVKIVNLTRNVRMVNKNPQSFQARCSIRWQTGFSPGIVEIGYAEFNGVSAISSDASGILGLNPSSTSIGTNVLRKSVGVSFNGVASVSGATVTYATAGSGLGVGFCAQIMPEFASAVFFGGASFTGVDIRSVGGVKLTDPAFCGGIAAVACATFGGGAAAIEVNGGYAVGVSFVHSGAKADNVRFSNFEIDGVTSVSASSRQFSGPDSFSNCTIGQLLGVGPSMSGGVSVGAKASLSFNSCTSPVPAFLRTTAGLSSASPSYSAISSNINNDQTLQERYTYGGQMVRENAIKKRGTSSVRFDCWFSANPITYGFVVKVPAGATINLRGSMRYSETYGAATPPTVTISGLGITPVVATCPTTAADTWHDYSISATNPNSYPGEFTVTYFGQSAANSTGAYCYFDGVPDTPWVDSARHFGYLFDGNAYRTDDPRITLSEAAALALPVSVNHGTSTITVSANATAREVFEACIADLCQTANIGQAVHIESATGATFSTTYTVALTGGAAITGAYTDSAGLHVNIRAENLLSGTRVRVFNVTDATELYNDVTASAGFVLPIIAPGTAKTIQLRAAKVGYLPVEVEGLLDGASLSFLDDQALDTTYLANGIDGSTVVGLTPDYPNLQIDANIAGGGITVQAIYAWTRWANTTADGIRLMHNVVQAQDGANYLIDTAVVDAKFDNNSVTPLVINGGYIRRSDGLTVIGEGAIQLDPGRAYVAAGATAITVPAGERVVTLASGGFLARG